MIKKTLKYLGSFFVAILSWFLLSDPGFFILEKTRKIEPGGPGEGVGVYFINLDSSIERRNKILPKIQALGYPYERISAVDGRMLSQKEITKVFDSQFHSLISDGPEIRGNIGCSLSHIKSWETFLKSDYKYAIIFEDDASFNPEVLRKIIDELSNSSKDRADIRYFHRLNAKGKTIKIANIGTENEEVLYFRKFASAAAYMVNRKAAASLLSTAYPIKLLVDIYLNRNWEFHLKDSLIKPMPVTANEGTSDRMERGHQDGYIEPKKKLSTRINRMKYRVKTIIARDIYQFIVFLKIKFGIE